MQRFRSTPKYLDFQKSPGTRSFGGAGLRREGPPLALKKGGPERSLEVFLLFSAPGYFDAHALAMDYRSLGFRECLAEVARYLSIIEGLDASDPLRVRLVSHLNNYASQREAASGGHAGLGHLPWGSAFGHAPHGAHPLLLPQSGHGNGGSAASPTDPHLQGRLAAAHPEAPTLRAPPSGGLGPVLPVVTSASKLSPPLLSSVASLSAFPFSFGSFHLLSPSALSPSAPTQAANLGKPYRPWGTEIGAF